MFILSFMCLWNVKLIGCVCYQYVWSWTSLLIEFILWASPIKGQILQPSFPSGSLFIFIEILVQLKESYFPEILSPSAPIDTYGTMESL